jgi:hypothetical protein
MRQAPWFRCATECMTATAALRTSRKSFLMGTTAGGFPCGRYSSAFGGWIVLNCFTCEDSWRRQLVGSPVRIQWDPERTAYGSSLPHRSLQPRVCADHLTRRGRWKLRVFRSVPYEHYRLTATDTPWSVGEGLEIRGPILAILMVLTRPVGLPASADRRGCGGA